jgi:hypothetical protein
MEDLIDQLSSLGETLAEHLTVALYLSSLPDSYGTLITALETRPEADLTQELVKNKLVEEYKRRTETATTASGSQEQQALKATTTVKDGRRTAAAATSSGTHITCFFCKKPNHMKKECRKYIEWKKRNPDHKAKAVSQYAVASNDDSDTDQGPDMCFRACTTEMRHSWYIDSGATSHMYGDRDFFCEVK